MPKYRILLLVLALTACDNKTDSRNNPVTQSWQLPQQALPFGSENLSEKRTSTELRPGVTLYRFERGYASPADHFDAEVGLAMSEEEAQLLEEQLAAAGFSSKRVIAARPELQPDNTGIWIRVNEAFSNQSDADAVVSALKEKGFSKARRRFTAEDGLETTGPWVINLLAISPNYKGLLRSELAQGIIPGKERTSELAKRVGAFAAINAGFFVVNPTMGTEGDLAGLSVINGRLVSEGTEGRPGYFLSMKEGKHQAYLEQGISTQLNLVTTDNVIKRIDGLNRTTGLNFSCGNPFDQQTFVALHDVVCTDPNEIIVFTQDFGPQSPSGEGIEVELDGAGSIVSVKNTRGGKIPEEGLLIQATGAGINWLQQHAKLGGMLKLEKKLINNSGKEIPLDKEIYAVNGGPTLLSKNKLVPYSQIVQEGFGIKDIPTVPTQFNNANRAYFVNDWFIRRSPHAAIGNAADGTILLVSVDGRLPKHSAGLSVTEMSTLMKHFGAVDAMKLDGGGSTMMVVNGEPQNVPSDATGERPDGDAIVLISNN